MDNRSVKQNILRLREMKNLTQEYIADSIGISLNAYWGLEKGDTNLISKRIPQIAKVLNVSVSEVLFGYDAAAEKESVSRLLDETDKKYEKEKALAIKDLLAENEALKGQIRDKEAQLKDKEKIIKLLESKNREDVSK